MGDVHSALRMSLRRLGSTPVPWMALLLALAGVGVRLAHNAAIMESPLYYLPLGGHVPFLDTARQILGGDLLPGDQPFTENSPLYPYILAAEWILSGGPSYLAARFWTILADAGTVAALYVLGSRLFGRGAGAVGAALYAATGSAVFFSTQLVGVSYAVLLITLSQIALLGAGIGAALVAGLLFALAVGLLPTLALGAPLLALAPLVMRRADPLRRCAAVVLGLVLGIAPVTCSNYLNSGSVVLLTASGGHNFYVGHNPAAAPGYQLPARIDGVPVSKRGSTFDAMRQVAEQVERRPFAPTEVSAYWMRRAFSYMAEHPAAEAKLLLRRAGASINSHETTTYDDYAYQQELSAALRYALPFGIVLPLAALGILSVSGRRAYPLLVPVVAAFASTIVFFYISRLRAPALPSLCLFAGHAVFVLAAFVRRGRWYRTATASAALAALLVVCNVRLVNADSSNEWNKVGIAFRLQGELEQAERAFLRARQENPRNGNTYMNLGALYEQRGDAERASTAYAEGRRLSR